MGVEQNRRRVRGARGRPEDSRMRTVDLEQPHLAQLGTFQPSRGRLRRSAHIASRGLVRADRRDPHKFAEIVTDTAKGMLNSRPNLVRAQNRYQALAPRDLSQTASDVPISPPRD
jgi:hypothetical protein